MNSVSGRRLPLRWLFVGVALAVILAAGVLLLRRFDPAEYSFYPKCVLHEVTGLHCPGCGSTRAVGALVDGRLMDAVRYNPLLIIGGPVILVIVFWKKKRKSSGEANWPAFLVYLLIFLIVYSIARNVPSPTRSIFAPPAKAPPAKALPAKALPAKDIDPGP